MTPVTCTPTTLAPHGPIGRGFGRIDGVEYFAAADIHRMLGIGRQTRWRRRTAQKIPQGRRYRDKRIVFTRQELGVIREYANRLEPADSAPLRRRKGDA
jgi:hypothetical protein